jgi:hypothetical protein
MKDRIEKLKMEFLALDTSEESNRVRQYYLNGLKMYNMGIIESDALEIVVDQTEAKIKELRAKQFADSIKNSLLETLSTATGQHKLGEEINAAALQWVRQNQGDARAFDAGARWAIEYMKSKTT